MRLRSFRSVNILIAVLALGLAASARSDNAADAATKASSPSRSDATAERIFQQEGRLVDSMHNYTPLVETYLQRMKPDPELDAVPDKDRYFLGRFAFGDKNERLTNTAFKDQNKARLFTRVLDRLDSFYRINYGHVSFMQMIFLNQSFDKDHYELRYLRQQFLGEVRTLVYDVVPRVKDHDQRFLGRIWVEDRDYNIVRFNGTY